MTFEPSELKKDFPILEDGKVFLDNAATTQKPSKLVERIQRFYEEENSNTGRGLYDLANKATSEYRKSRRTIAEFINAQSDELVFVRNTTEAYNLLAYSLQIEGKIVVSEMAHHSEQLPLRRKAEIENRDINYLPTENGEISLEAAEEIIDQNTGLVSISHISNVFGKENPVKDIIELAHENDAYVVVDGAQSVPRKPIDVKQLDADLLTFSGHKMLGPTGIGVLYGKKQVLRDMKPYQVGGGMIKSVRKDEVRWEDPPEKFEAGTPNIAGAVGLAEAVRYLENIGMKNIERHEKRLVREIEEGLNSIEGVETLTENATSLVSFTTDFAHPHDVAEILNQNSIAVRAGHHCAQPQMESLNIAGATRVSPYLYNTSEDVEKFLEAVETVREVFE